MIKEKVEIPLSKLKLSLLLVLSIVFIVGGIWFVFKPKEISAGIYPMHPNPVFIFITGVASILFFGICSIFMLRKITDDTPGLIVDADGITDNSSGTSVGFIPWKDIKDIKKISIANQKMIMIIVKNPEEYIDKQTNFIKKKTIALNYKYYQSPISISSNGLKCSFPELYNMIVKEFDAALSQTN